jgi:unsaturated rhamnogalacturonyl hydrolase
MSSIKTLDVAEKAFDKHCSVTDLNDYSGILSLGGLSRLWQWTQEERFLNKFKKHIKPFINGDIKNRMGAYHLYNVGGSPSALMLKLGAIPEAETPIKEKVEDLLTNCGRSREGIFSSQTWDVIIPDQVWIDVAFALCPFLCNAGIYFNEDSWIDEAVDQIALLEKLLKNPKNGLYHQSRGFCGTRPNLDPEKISDDHWSRGNGWGIFALAELVLDLPENHHRRPETEKLLKELVEACLNFQDEYGMWHQEITDFDSFTETSGTGKILYALGVALEKGIVSEDKKENLIKGLKGYTAYIGLDGSIHNCCAGCLCPGNGTIEEYKNQKHPLNDCHAFGPVILAFGQAAKIGINEITV